MPSRLLAPFLAVLLLISVLACNKKQEPAQEAPGPSTSNAESNQAAPAASPATNAPSASTKEAAKEPAATPAKPTVVPAGTVMTGALGRAGGAQASITGA